MKVFHQSTIPIAERPRVVQKPLLRWWHIYLIFICWTLFAVFVFSRYSTLGDSHGYLTGAYEEDTNAARTVAIALIGQAVTAIVGSEQLAQLVFSLGAATGVAYMVKHASLHGRFLWPFLAIMLTPNFGIWASVAGRESIFVTLLGFFLGSVLNYHRRPRFRLALLAMVCVAGMIFIRAPYGLGTALFLLMFLLYRSAPRSGVSIGVQALLFAAISGLVLMFLWPHVDAYITIEALPKAKSYFTVRSETTRLWITMNTTGDLFASLWWSLPLALLGPTPAEVMARPMTLPFLLSGVVVLGCFLYSLVLAFCAPSGVLRKVLVLGWFPAIVIILIAYVPFGIYNPGSAIRYASCFLLFLIFPSLLLSADSTRAVETR